MQYMSTNSNYQGKQHKLSLNHLKRIYHCRLGIFCQMCSVHNLECLQRRECINLLHQIYTTNYQTGTLRKVLALLMKCYKIQSKCILNYMLYIKKQNLKYLIKLMGSHHQQINMFLLHILSIVHQLSMSCNSQCKFGIKNCNLRSIPSYILCICHIQ